MMEENSLEEVAKTLREAILQKQKFKIATETLKTTLDNFRIKINTKTNQLESNRRTEGQNARKIHLEKEPKSKIDLLGLKGRQGNRLLSEKPSGKRQKTNENQTDDDYSHSNESDIGIYTKGNLEDDDNDKNGVEKTIASHEHKELQHMFSEGTGQSELGKENL